MASKGRTAADLMGNATPNGIPTDSIADSAVTGNKLADNIEFPGDYVKLPGGNTASRPVSPTVGTMRYNTDNAAMEQYTDGGWRAIEAPPVINSISPSDFSGNSGTQLTISGDNFKANPTVKIVLANGTELTPNNVNRQNQNTITLETPRDITLDEAPIGVKVVNVSGLSASRTGAVGAGSAPVFSTSSGSLGQIVEGDAGSFSVSASDPDGGAITYSIQSGALPPGLSLNANSGAISGTANAVSATTLRTFTVRATDSVGNSTDRQFTINHIHKRIILLQAWGAGGGGGNKNAGCGTGPGGGSGGYIEMTSDDQLLPAGTSLVITVGQGGERGSGGGWPNGGNGGDGNAGKGGGATYVTISGGDLLIVGGSGGGQGSHGGYPTGGGGSKAGTQTMGGTAGTGGYGGGGSAGSNGGYLSGGTGMGCNGGGGGAGYYGGGGGNGDCGACSGAGGGGGSSYANSSYYTSFNHVSPSQFNESNYGNGAAAGGGAAGGNGGPGRIAITVDGSTTVFDYAGNSTQSFTIPS